MRQKYYYLSSKPIYAKVLGVLRTLYFGIESSSVFFKITFHEEILYICYCMCICSESYIDFVHFVLMRLFVKLLATHQGDMST